MVSCLRVSLVQGVAGECEMVIRRLDRFGHRRRWVVGTTGAAAALGICLAAGPALACVNGASPPFADSGTGSGSGSANEMQDSAGSGSADQCAALADFSQQYADVAAELANMPGFSDWCSNPSGNSAGPSDQSGASAAPLDQPSDSAGSGNQSGDAAAPAAQPTGSGDAAAQPAGSGDAASQPDAAAPGNNSGDAAQPAADSGSAAAAPDPSASKDCPGPVPTDAGIDPYYTQYCLVDGISLIAGPDVAPLAIQTAADYTTHMLAHRPDIAKAMTDAPMFHIGITASGQNPRALPNWITLPSDEAERRGYGASDNRPSIDSWEEDLVCQDSPGSSDFVHELGHAILTFGALRVDQTYKAKVEKAYNDALAAGRYSGLYASQNFNEYWAGLVQAYFDTNGDDNPDLNTREDLATYDPEGYKLVDAIFGGGDWRPTCPASTGGS